MRAGGGTGSRGSTCTGLPGYRPAGGLRQAADASARPSLGRVAAGSGPVAQRDDAAGHAQVRGPVGPDRDPAVVVVVGEARSRVPVPDRLAGAEADRGPEVALRAVGVRRPRVGVD